MVAKQATYEPRVIKGRRSRSSLSRVDRLYDDLGVSKEVISKIVDGSKKKKTFGCILIFFCNNGTNLEIS